MLTALSIRNIVLIEKLAPHGHRIAQALGVAMIAAAVYVLV